MNINSLAHDPEFASQLLALLDRDSFVLQTWSLLRFPKSLGGGYGLVLKDVLTRIEGEQR